MADEKSAPKQKSNPEIMADKLPPKSFDELLPLAGDFGLYQVFLFFVTLPFYCYFSFVYYTQIFLTQPSDHWCYVPELKNFSVSERKSLSIPQTENGYSKCYSYNINWTEFIQTGIKPDTNDIIKCQNGWEYGIDIPYQTITTELNWVCDRDSYQATAQSIFFVGAVIGGFIFGFIGDQFGRIPAAVGANVVACIGGVASSYTRNFWQFALTRFMVGLSYDNCLMMIYILEYTAPKYRTIMSNLSFALFYTTATCALPWIALACADWKTLSIALSAPMALSLLTPFVVPESPRWLLSKGRSDEALQKLRKIGQVNKKVIPEKVLEEFKESQRQSKTTEDCNLFDILKIPVLRNTFFLISLLFMITSIVFDTLVRIAGEIGSDFFISFTIASLTEFPSLLLLVFVMDWLGRRWMTSGTFVISCIFCILAAFVPEGSASLACVVISRFVINMSFNGVIQWAAELLPSGARGLGAAVVHICGYLATILAPYVVYLQTIQTYLPLLVIGLLSAAGCIIALKLPETSCKDIPQTKEDAVLLVESSRFWDMPFLKKTKSVVTKGHENENFEM